MLWMGKSTRETPFTLPKPLAHLFCHIVNIVLEGSVRRGGRAYRDLISVLMNSLIMAIPDPSKTPVMMIATERNKLQVIHLVLLTLAHHLCTPFRFHFLGSVLDPRLHSLLINCLKKESIASPNVASVGSRDLTTVMTIQQALTRLQQITAIMIPSENCTLHLSSTLSFLHAFISTSTSSPIISLTSHGRPHCHLRD